MICRHCKPDDNRTDKLGNCYAHCQETENGRHVPDPRTVTPASDGVHDWVMDVLCLKCGISGSVVINPDDIQWD